MLCESRDVALHRTSSLYNKNLERKRQRIFQGLSQKRTSSLLVMLNKNLVQSRKKASKNLSTTEPASKQACKRLTRKREKEIFLRFYQLSNPGNVRQFGRLRVAKCWANTGIFDFIFTVTAIS